MFGDEKNDPRDYTYALQLRLIIWHIWSLLTLIQHYFGFLQIVNDRFILYYKDTILMF